MEPDSINDNTKINHISIDNNNTSTANGSDLIHQQHSSDTEDSQTEGKPSPPPPPPPPPSATAAPATIPSLQQPATRQQSPSTDTDRSTSPTRSKKRAIDTMLEGEEDKECIVMEKQPAPPPLPKRQTPPSPTKSKMSSSSSPTSPTHPPATFIDHALHAKGDLHYEQASVL